MFVTACAGGTANQQMPFSANADGCVTPEQCQTECETHGGDACKTLAFRYELGAGVRQDYATAARLYQSACSNGVGEACTRLAIMYDIGLSVPESPRQALLLYQQACDLGEDWSCRRAAQLH